MSLDDLPSSARQEPAETAVRRVDRASPSTYKITRAEELRLQLADEILRGDRIGADAAMRAHIELVREEYELYAVSV